MIEFADQVRGYGGKPLDPLEYERVYLGPANPVAWPCQSPRRTGNVHAALREQQFRRF